MSTIDTKRQLNKGGTVPKLEILINALSKNAIDQYCLVDETGNIEHMSTVLSSKCGKASPSIFFINPELSMISWKKIISDLESEAYKLWKTTIVVHDDQTESCEVLILKLMHTILYIVLCKKDKSELAPITERVSIPKGSKVLSQPYSFDEHGPNGVLYIDSSGHISFFNKKMQELLTDDRKTAHIDELFLETDLGPLLPSFEKLAKQNTEAVLQMVMKSHHGFIRGYSRLTFHDDASSPGKYRLEFAKQEDIKLYGDSLINALEEIQKLNSDFENQKGLFLEEAIDNFNFDDIVTQSTVYKEILRQVALVADTNTTVLITGETGTGKELLCNSIFKLSDRSDKVIVKVNCGSIPSELMESTLFGHEKGAFTGADKQKIGKFELADGGTIFLDEIGELPLNLQPKLLRVLQEGEIERVGNPKPMKIDVRIIAATNRDLDKMVKEGTFRADLFYRLNVFPIHNIPLRERTEDIPILVKHFLNKTNKKTGRNVMNISKKDFGFLTRYHYPGNIRELENIIERGVILANEDMLDLSFLHKSKVHNESDFEGFVTFEEMQKKYIIKVLKETKGKVSGEGSASEILDVNNKTLTSRMKKLGIDPRNYI